MLNATETNHWRRHGWLWLKKFFSQEEALKLRSWAEEISGWPELPGKWMRYYERNPKTSPDKVLARIENFEPYHTELALFLCSEMVKDLLAECADEPVVLFKDKINYKKAGGRGFAPHQDAPAYIGFGIEYFITMMIPVDNFTEENGCLELALDACQRVFLPQNPDGTLHEDTVQGLAVERVLAESGDVIIFDGYVPHWSGPNRSLHDRRAYYLTFNLASMGDKRCEYYLRKRQLFPPDCERIAGVDYSAIGRQFNLANPFD